MRKKCIRMAMAALAAGIAAFGQVSHRAPAGPPAEGPVMLHSGQGGGVVGWMVAEMGPGRVVKGAPYSATAITDRIQILADGNRIHSETTGAVYRDSEGRTRNETPVASSGATNPNAPPQFITITDPVASVSYVLDPAKKTAVKTVFLGTRRPSAGTVQHAGGGGAPGAAGPAETGPRARPTRPRGVQPEQPGASEQLGTKAIEGVQAEGTRVTHTIPAGQIGNEKPIEVVSERWYSPQLQVMVATTFSDPRTGTNTYRLTRINLGEPDHSLFEAPADYTIKEGGFIGGVPSRQPAAKHE